MRGAGLGWRRAVSLGASLAALTLTVAGCGTQAASSGSTISGSTLTIYASQPAGPGDQSTSDTLDAERLAFQGSGGKVGNFKVNLVVLHGAELSDNARTAIQDKTAIAYLGELSPGTSGVSVQINNQLGLLQVSPLDTAIYLTQPTAAVPGAPTSYYPLHSTYHDTFARVAPTGAQEAKAVVAEMHSLRRTRLYVSSDGSPYGASLAQQVRQDAPSQGLSLVSAAADADAVFVGARPSSSATRALDQAAASSPRARLFVGSALYDEAFVAGLSRSAQSNLYISSPGFATTDLSASARQFVARFTAAYRHAPAPQAIFGYEAVSALLAVLAQAGPNAANRGDVVKDFRTLKDRQSPLGTYSIVGGDTSIAPFIFARPVGGQLVARPAG